MKKFWTAMLGILWLTVGLTAAGVRLKVSSTRVAPGQSVKVKIEAEGKDVLFPPIRKIGEYPVENLRKSSSSQYRMINGKFSSSSKKILSFEFFPEKTVILPPLKVTVDGKAYQTPSTKIEVSKEAGGQGGFSIRMKANKKELYRGEPLIVTVDVVEPINGAVSQIQYTPPEFKGFAAKALGGERQIRKGNVTIHELRYLLTPEEAGARQIGPAAVRVGIRDLNAPADPFGIFGTPMKWIALRSNLLTIRVKPLPADADLVGHYSLKAKVDRKKVKANEPVNYTLEIVGEGSLEDLTDPRFDIPGVTVYSDDAQVKSSIKDGKLYSRYSKKYLFISDRSFEIPSLKLKEFDYQTGKSRTLQTPAFSITVTGAGGAAAPAAPPAGMKAQTPVAPQAQSQTGAKPAAPTSGKKSENLLEDPAYYARKAYEEKAARLPWYLAGAFAAGALLALIMLRFWPRRGKKAILPGMKSRHYSLDEALKILYPHTNDDPDVEKVVRYLYRVKNGEKQVQIDRSALDRLAAKYDRSNG